MPFPECQYDQWAWLCVYAILYSGTPHYLTFIPDSNTGEMNITTCRTENYPVEDLPAGNEFGVNQPCAYDAGEESRGAVKAVYRQGAPERLSEDCRGFEEPYQEGFHMKKVIKTFLILIFISTGVDAYNEYMVAFFTEGDDPMQESCDILVADYTTVCIRMWIRNELTARGLKGFELGVDFDSEDSVAAEGNPGVPCIIGDLTTTAFAGAFQECQTTDWVWIVKYSLIYMGEPHYVYAVPNSDTGNFIVTSCESGFPIYNLSEGNMFGVNLPCG